MSSTIATVGVAPIISRVDRCELCARPSDALRTAVIVRHSRGGAIQFAACDACATAMRRIIAAVGSTSSPGAIAQVALDVDVLPTLELVDFSTADVVGDPVMVFQFAEPFHADDGLSYIVRVWGQGRADGTWIGWVSFVARDGTTRRTPRETSQSSREHLAYWATGLELSYLEGAFGRAHLAASHASSALT